MEKLGRAVTEEIYKEKYGNKKADFWVCGFDKAPSSKKTKCAECGKVCYYDSKMKFHLAKKTKKICLECGLKMKPDLLDDVKKGMEERFRW